MYTVRIFEILYLEQEFKQALTASKQDWKKVWNVQKSNDREWKSESDHGLLLKTKNQINFPGLQMMANAHFESYLRNAPNSL